MDPVTLAQTVTTFLASNLIRFGENFAEDASKKLWDGIRKKLSNRPSAATIIREFASKSDDSDIQEAFATQLQKALIEDHKFAQEVSELIQQIQTSRDTSTSDENKGVGNIVIGGDVSGNIVIGNNIEQRLAGNPTVDAPPPEDDEKKRRK